MSIESYNLTFKNIMYTHEKDLKRDAIEWLQWMLPNALILDTPTSAKLVAGGRRTKSTSKGKSDLHLCVEGKAVYPEAKLPGNTLSEDQIKFKKKVERAKGIFIEFHSIDELEKSLRFNELLK